ncbi:hypothetical protein NP233_g11701 [Leucocoprinus birnbaumii]|uniref:ribonuclease H n=1 Tax=Leucocoprinus birnbaumii TaxID=56174 RepID=A0AAD5VGZ7_9AGAR|nr:hypothetical protein NP233_g11701 [Leucocoprinus birnbaumii]
MVDRVYHPPKRRGERTPATVVSHREGAEFSLLRQRRYFPNGGSYLGAGPGIAIFVDGSCLSNGRHNSRDVRAGMGVYFGPNSIHNLSEPLLEGPQTSNRAELQAAILALRKVQRLFCLGDLTPKQHIAIIADSAYVVNGMTDWVYGWRKNGWRAADGGPIRNEADFKKLDNLVRTLEGLGMTIRFWRVDREHNQDADELAKEGAMKGDPSFG